ncbi:uncharacterized protein LOC120189879 [Hibiscus syriacus]|uniref:uncharacterized protein LOC120189879 n=1 Tax=Hibiscus syriacus TaxID=106335 RepID=UPI001923CF7D|nr:uncharacterized protein LOC120189879 [Hibiscus syriacus]XP_039048957.1 uncharacterized protein LOC120189879 [Hibiscus syriacus]XP_039048958.1 uncharacterized protein LOC120189879 [Hibiscus syriacus]XP_039048959.1 uncharacterized protein LOC120189879 [Hibiscus syriacus]
MDLVIKRSSWSFEGDFFFLAPYAADKGLDEYSFEIMAVWVRIYNLPLGAMTKQLRLDLGSCIGKVLAVDMRLQGGNLVDFLRVRVEIDIITPLRRYVLLGNRKGGKPRMCPVKYERLLNCCFECGILGHATVSCTVQVEQKVKPPYDDWLKVPMQQPRVKSQLHRSIKYARIPRCFG